RDSVENREAGAGGTLGIVVVGLGIAEERHHAVAEVFGDVAAEAAYRLSHRALIGCHRLAPLLGVEPSGYLRRANQVAEEHRQMTPLACRAARAWFSLRINRRGSV